MTTARPSRRQFLIGVASTAGLVVGYRLVGPAGLRANAQAATAPANPFQAYVEITPENRILIHSSQFEMGQGSYFGIATLVMEELDGDWAQVDVIGASGNPALYGNLAWGGVAQGTGGSTSMTSSWQRYRQAGAAARAMLVAAAAKQWNVPAGEITVASGIVSHRVRAKRAFGELAAAAAAMPVPDRRAAEAEGGMDADRIGRAEALRFGRQDERHPDLHDRREDGRPADGRHDSSAEIRRRRSRASMRPRRRRSTASSTSSRHRAASPSSAATCGRR